ncbi:MAG: O-antigen ligase family protein [Clostridia bacterium]|nr:O-antigen ligase family protein [Clostridia bacterium]
MKIKLINLTKISWILLFISSITFPSEKINYFIRIIALGMSIFTWLYLGKKNNFKIMKNSFSIFMLLYLVFAVFSTIISVNKFMSFFKAIELFMDFIIASIILQMDIKHKEDNFSVDNFVKMIVRCSLIVISIIWIGYFIKPELFSTQSKGLLSKQLGANCLLSSNACGCTATLVMIWYLVYGSKKEKIIVIPYMLITVIFSMSRTAILISVIAFLLDWLLLNLKIKNVCIFAIALSVFYKYQDYFTKFFIRGQSDSDFSTLSGRTLMWQEVIRLAKSSFIYGYGFGAGSNLIKLNGIEMESVHNGFFEVLLDLGIVGTVLLFFVFIFSLKFMIQRIRLNGIKESRYSVLIHVYLLVRTFFSLGIGGWHTIDTMLFIIITMNDIAIVIKNSK